MEPEPVLCPGTRSDLLGAGRTEIGSRRGLVLKSASPHLFQLLKPGTGRRKMRRSSRGKSLGFNLFLPLGSFVTLGKSFNFSGL